MSQHQYQKWHFGYSWELEGEYSVLVGEGYLTHHSGNIINLHQNAGKRKDRSNVSLIHSIFRDRKVQVQSKHH